MTKIGLNRTEFEAELTKAFPKLYSRLGGSSQETCMAWGISVDTGWFDIIWELSEKLEPLIENDDFCAEQVKEKFGGLRFYLSSYNNEEAQKLVQEAEQKTYETCERCGETGITRRGGWYMTLCEKHDEERRQEYQREGIDID